MSGDCEVKRESRRFVLTLKVTQLLYLGMVDRRAVCNVGRSRYTTEGTTFTRLVEMWVKIHQTNRI